jgi:hypothetical protein
MTSAQVRAEVGRGRSTVVVPFGAVERHGPCLPLDTDAVLGDRLGLLLGERVGALCAPTMRMGCLSTIWRSPGRCRCGPKTLQAIVHDLVDSLAGTASRGASSNAGRAYVAAFLDAIHDERVPVCSRGSVGSHEAITGDLMGHVRGLGAMLGVVDEKGMSDAVSSQRIPDR